MAARLSRASVLALALAVFIVTPATATDRACTRETIGRLSVQAELQTTIEAIFERRADGHADVPQATTIFMPLEVVMVRVKDGKPVLACVDSKEAARRFLTAPVEAIAGKVAEEK